MSSMLFMRVWHARISIERAEMSNAGVREYAHSGKGDDVEGTREATPLARFGPHRMMFIRVLRRETPRESVFGVGS